MFIFNEQKPNNAEENPYLFDTYKLNAADDNSFLTTCLLEYGNGVFYPETEYDAEPKVLLNFQRSDVLCCT